MGENGFKRIEYFDFLRFVAILAVITIHVSAQNWNHVDVSSGTWMVFCFFNSLSRWAVPIFLMISGTLFLKRNYDFKRIYYKNILKIIVAFIFWSLVYSIFNYLSGYDKNYILESLFVGHYHLWYMFLIIGLYILVPLLKKLLNLKLL